MMPEEHSGRTIGGPWDFLTALAAFVSIVVSSIFLVGATDSIGDVTVPLTIVVVAIVLIVLIQPLASFGRWDRDDAEQTPSAS